MRVLTRSLILGAALASVPVASVAAHECIVANRSEGGNAGASNSNVWITVSLRDIFETAEDHGFPDLTAAQVTFAIDLASASGVPDAFTFRADTLLGGNGVGWEGRDKATDGKGIDHFFAIYGDRLIGALFAALENA
ncbi:MAG TPA: hypothetical protein VLA44_00920 [Clostridia bacterium]|nr:hypothetical protein [Clostridia bacterium]